LHLMGYTPLSSTDETFWMDDEEIADYINYPYRREKIKAIHKPLDFDQRLKEFDKFPLYYTSLYNFKSVKPYFERLFFALIRPDLRLPLDSPLAARAKSKEEVEFVLSQAAEMKVKIPQHVDPRTFLLNSLRSYPWRLQKQMPWSAFGARQMPSMGDYLSADTVAFNDGLWYLVRPAPFTFDPEEKKRNQKRGKLSWVEEEKGIVCQEKKCLTLPLPLPCRKAEENFSDQNGNLFRRKVWRCQTAGKGDKSNTVKFEISPFNSPEKIQSYSSQRLDFRLELFHAPTLEELPVWDWIYNQESTANLAPPLKMKDVGIKDVFTFRSRFPYGSWKTDFPPEFLKQVESIISRQEKNVQALLNFTYSSYSFNTLLMGMKGSQKTIDLARKIGLLIESMPPLPGPLVLFRGVFGDSFLWAGPGEEKEETPIPKLRRTSRGMSTKEEEEIEEVEEVVEVERKKINQLKAGDLYQEYGLASKTYWRGVAENFIGSTCCLLEIHYPPGHKVLPLPAFASNHPLELEYLTRPRETFRVKEIKYDSNPNRRTKILVLEYFPPEREINTLELIEEVAKDVEQDKNDLENLQSQKELFQKALDGDKKIYRIFFPESFLLKLKWCREFLFLLKINTNRCEVTVLTKFINTILSVLFYRVLPLPGANPPFSRRLSRSTFPRAAQQKERAAPPRRWAGKWPPARRPSGGKYPTCPPKIFSPASLWPPFPPNPLPAAEG